MSAHRCPTPLGYKEIAIFLGVKGTTPSHWAQRRHVNGFPDPDGHISGKTPYWNDTTIEAWARARRPTLWAKKGGSAAERLELDRERRHAEEEATARAADAERLRIRLQALQAELEQATAAQQAAEEAAEALGGRPSLAG